MKNLQKNSFEEEEEEKYLVNSINHLLHYTGKTSNIHKKIIKKNHQKFLKYTNLLSG